MACSEIHAQLLSPAGMQSLRAVIVREYPFVIHYALKDSVYSISKNGLLPRFPKGADTYADMDCVCQCLGVQYPPILCFTLPGNPISFGSRKPRVEFAIASSNLPNRIGVDWSFGDYWSSVERERLADPNKTIEDVFLRVFRRFKTIAAYDSVSPHLLLVRLRSSSPDPSSWPAFGTLLNHDDLLIYSD